MPVGAEKTRSLLELELTPLVVDALLAERPAVVSREGLSGRRKASMEQRVTLSAVLGSATVSWRELLALCVGDVIVLDQKLSAPCTLQLGAASPIAEAQLGHVNNMLAAQVTRIRNPS